MASIVLSLTRQLANKGNQDAKDMAIGILKEDGILSSKGTLTAYGKERQDLGKAGRAKSRAAKYSGGKPEDYKYNARTHQVLKRTK